MLAGIGGPMKSLAALLLAGFISSSAFANPQIKCSADQSHCVIREKGLAIGDVVGIITPDNEIIAIGKVEKIDGPNRRIEFTTKLGDIKSTHRFVRLESDSLEEAKKRFRPFYKSAKISAGAALSYAKITVGDGLTAFMLDGFGEHAWQDGFEFVGRASLIFGSGVVNGEFFAPTLEGQYSMYALAVLPGIAYHLRKDKPWGIRSELGLGFAYASASVDGNSEIVDQYDTSINQGFGMVLRAETTSQFRFDSFRSGFGAGYQRLHGANSFYLTATMSFEIEP
jgi:hypothetical protein